MEGGPGATGRRKISVHRSVNTLSSVSMQEDTVRMQEDTVQQIHATSLALLDDPGVRIEHDGLCAKLIAAGARAGSAAQVIRFPAAMVMEYVRLAPSEVLLADRTPNIGRIGAGQPARVWSTPGLSLWHAGKHRAFTSEDMARMSRLLDQLPEVHGVFGMAMADVPAPVRDVVGLRIMAENTRKHIRVLSFTPEGAEAICAMRAVVDSSPWLSVGFTAHGPLRWTRLALDIFARTAGHRIPASINGEPMAGVSGPTTLAGAAAVGNAEILSGIVINQLLEPGRPVIHNLGLAHIFDMRTSIAVTGAPENHLMARLGAALGRFYELPSCSWVSTESMLPDGQAALEKTAGFLSHLQSGNNLVWGVGQLESELSVSPAQAVIDNEILGYVRRYLRGVEINDDSLALSVTRDVGIAGSFLAEEHTVRHCRSEFFEPALLFRGRRADWIANGSQSLYERAEAQAEKLMARSVTHGLTDDQVAELRRIEAAFTAKMTR